MECRNCGASNLDGAERCSGCGTPIVSEGELPGAENGAGRPHKSRWILISVVVVATIGLIGVLLSAGGGGATGGSVSGHAPPDEQTAVRAIAEYEESPSEPEFESAEAYVGGTVDVYLLPASGGDFIRYFVDQVSGTVVRRDDPRRAEGDDLISLEMAIQGAHAFVEQHFSFFERDRFLESPPEIPAEPLGSSVYTFEWNGVDQATGVHLPSLIVVEVDAFSGEVRSFVAIDVSVEVPLIPQVTKEEAVETARDELALDGGWSLEAHLVVGFDPDTVIRSSQLLLWVVIAAGEESGLPTEHSVLVDALSGEVVHVDLGR